jgi:hypothetical protein
MMMMDRWDLERIGDRLRHLGHERREAVEQISREIRQGDEPGAKELYQQLDQISEQCMHLLQEQRDLISAELGGE